MTFQKTEWLAFCDQLREANGFEARELLLRGPLHHGEPARDWPAHLPGIAPRREVEIRAKGDADD